MKISNRTFIVSGGSSGLGLATTHDLLTQPNVYISIIDRSPPPADLLTNPHIKYIHTDITNVDQIERAVEKTVDWTKETRAALGGIVNCAGVGVVSKVTIMILASTLLQTRFAPRSSTPTTSPTISPCGTLFSP